MVDTLVNNHNKLVAPEDEVIMAGDVCYQKTPEWLPNVSRFNGRKILIRGNHDRGITDEQFEPYFTRIIPDGCGLVKEICGIPCYITHYPSEGRADAFNLVGHIHSAWKYQLNMLNIGVDVHQYKPVCLDSIRFHLDAICKYYDEDVWVAYNEINAKFRGQRGKKGTYFRPVAT
jgi:calcineurin-like phosphoesterase family protein